MGVNNTSQTDLFADLFRSDVAEPWEGCDDVDTQVRKILAADVKTYRERTNHCRIDLAATLSHLTGAKITEYSINNWTSVEKNAYRFPFTLAAAWMHATGCRRLVQWLDDQMGLQVMGSEEVRLTKLGKVIELEEQIREEKRALKRGRK